MYQILKDDADINRNYSGKNWAFQSKTILQLLQHGLEYVWNNQYGIEIPFAAIKQRIFDMYSQKWYSDINNSSRLQSYCICKHDFKQEKYLNTVTEIKYRIAVSRFTTSSHSLFIETGRYDNTPLTERICKNMQYEPNRRRLSFLLACPGFREIGSK